MIVYDCAGFPNPARIKIAVAEKGLQDHVSFVQIDVPNGGHKAPDFLLKNPFAAVPVLELEDGSTISECTAITEYLDHLDGAPTLTGRTPKERALAHMMQRRAEHALLDAATAYFHHATAGLGPNIELYQNSEWGENQRRRAIAGLGYFNGVLVSQPYVAGDDFTMAGITVFAGLAFADFVKITIPDGHTHLKFWRDRVGQRPSIAN